MRQICGRAQDRIVKDCHPLSLSFKSNGSEVSARRKILQLLDLGIKTINGGDILIAQAVQKMNRRRASQADSGLHASRKIQQHDGCKRRFFSTEIRDGLLSAILNQLEICAL